METQLHCSPAKNRIGFALRTKERAQLTGQITEAFKTHKQTALFNQLLEPMNTRADAAESVCRFDREPAHN